MLPGYVDLLQLTERSIGRLCALFHRYVNFSDIFWTKAKNPLS